MALPVNELQQYVQTEVDKYMQGFEQRLAASMTKALDTVVYDLEERLRGIEEDQARLLRHLGLDK